MSAILASSLRPAIGVLTKTFVRHNSYARHISGPPRVRISFAEKVAHGIVFAVGCSIVPLIVTSNIPKYNQEQAEED